MPLKPLLFVLSLSLPLGAVAQTGAIIAPSEAIVTITVGDLPVIVSRNSAVGTRGTAFNYQIVAVNNPTNYGATGLPAGLTLNSSTGLISGTLFVTGTYSITLTTTNAAGDYTTTLTLTFNSDLNADDDGDGMPNAWELSHGLNPNDPADAGYLALGGVITNLQAYSLGLNPNSPKQSDSYSPTQLNYTQTQLKINKPQ